MKLLSTPRQRVVIFHGLTLIIPSWAKYVAADTDGSVYAYDHKPVMVDDYEWRRVTGTYTIICDVDLEGLDWRNSLVIYEDFKL